MMNSNRERNGRIITFYSFKGGSGRSMSLANIAVLLARSGAGMTGNRVLIMDWDLEAPGLHEFYKAYVPEESLASQPGIIDLFMQANEHFSNGISDDNEVWGFIDQFFTSAAIRLNLSDELFLLKAGKFDEQYSLAVQTFDWRGFFDRCHPFLTILIRYLKEKYNYTLIDSRTGLTDVGGICTAILPEALIAVFTPTRQGLRVTEVAERAVNYRKGANDLRPLVVYPLASRIDTSAEDLNQKWKKDYTHLFEQTFDRIYDLRNCNLKPYFGKIEVHYVTNYSYGESIAVLDNSDVINKHELPAKYNELVQLLIGEYMPWEMPDMPEPRLVSAADHTNFAQLLAKNKEFKRAERHFYRAIELEPDRGGAYYDFIQYLENKEEWDRVEAVFDEWIQVPDDSAWSRLNWYASILIERGSLEKAYHLLNQFIDKYENIVPLQSTYAQLLAKRSELGKAELVFKKLIQQQPDNQSVLADYASFLWQSKNDYPAAEQLYRELAKQEKEPGAYDTILVNLMLLQGKTKEAETLLLNLLAQDDLSDYVKCLLWFLRLVYFPEAYKLASKELAAFIDNGITLPGRNFDADLKMAELNKHPHLADIQAAAARLASDWAPA